MKKPEEVTYLFGAGASYYSMPLVENFANRFVLFRQFIFENSRVAKDGFLNDCDKFLEEVSSHLSFDTFFKKMFHRQDSSLTKFKAILLIFFLYEELRDMSKLDFFTNPEQYGNKYGVKKGNLDPRYDALIAGLLNPIRNSFSLITKLNLITWNYDTNLISAVKNFKSSDARMSDFFKTYETSINHFIVDPKLQIVHLNGRVFHPKYSKSKISSTQDLIVEIEALVGEYSKIDRNNLGKYAEEISFSWETLSGSKFENQLPLHIEAAIKAIKRSSVLVIIGYSFPLYNRIIDSYLLSQNVVGGKIIYIQDPRAKELKEILQNDFDLFVRDQVTSISERLSVVIKPIESCSSFFVPSNLYVTPYDPNIGIK